MRRFQYFPWQGPKNHVCSEPRKTRGMDVGSRARCTVCGQWWVLYCRWDAWDGWTRFWEKESDDAGV